MHLNFETMEMRHLIYVYAGVWIVQGGYLGWIVWQWFHTKKPWVQD